METKKLIQEKYGATARGVRKSGSVACGDPALRCCDPITTNLYDEAEKSGLPANAVLASLGCGNPTALIKLKPGERVLDLGSGGGIDVLLSAKRVGPTGKAYGLDMTDDMLALARENQRQAGVENVEFLKGEMENIPLPDNSVDVVISNCVINLSADKDRVLREAFRVLKPGGRFAVSDIVVRGEVPDVVRKNMLLWAGCVSGALEEREYTAKLAAAGFTGISVEVTRVHSVADARHFLGRRASMRTLSPRCSKASLSAPLSGRQNLEQPNRAADAVSQAAATEPDSGGRSCTRLTTYSCCAPATPRAASWARHSLTQWARAALKPIARAAISWVRSRPFPKSKRSGSVMRWRVFAARAGMSLPHPARRSWISSLLSATKQRAKSVHFGPASR